MNCPRCTHDLPADSRFCPACGLDLEKVSEETLVEEAPPLENAEDKETEASAPPEEMSPWPQWLALQTTRSAKKPALASTLAFFLGPFTYLYLEQPVWFWWGLLGGILLCILSQGALVFILHIGGMLHAWDTARILNERLDIDDFEALPIPALEEESI